MYSRSDFSLAGKGSAGSRLPKSSAHSCVCTQEWCIVMSEIKPRSFVSKVNVSSFVILKGPTMRPWKIFNCGWGNMVPIVWAFSFWCAKLLHFHPHQRGKDSPTLTYVTSTPPYLSSHPAINSSVTSYLQLSSKVLLSIDPANSPPLFLNISHEWDHLVFVHFPLICFV